MHAAAPCPVQIKKQMIDWWGPIVDEYYASSEAIGSTLITAEDWLAHPGSVGKPMLGGVHILDEDGNELPPGQAGEIYFEGGYSFEYLNDPTKTAASRDKHGWVTVGDVGYLDDEGYLYLTDRRHHMIISGGVNIYPQEAENLLVTHPKVLDAAVFGVPDDEMGQRVVAVVQTVDPADATDEFGDELLAWLRDRLSHFKCPRSIAFEAQLPRTDTGKLYKNGLIEKYSAVTDAPGGRPVERAALTSAAPPGVIVAVGSAAESPGESWLDSSDFHADRGTVRRPSGDHRRLGARDAGRAERSAANAGRRPARVCDDVLRAVDPAGPDAGRRGDRVAGLLDAAGRAGVRALARRTRPGPHARDRRSGAGASATATSCGSGSTGRSGTTRFPPMRAPRCWRRWPSRSWTRR